MYHQGKSMHDKKTEINGLKKEGMDLMRSHRLDEAKSVYARICSLEPSDANAWYILSCINGMIGNLDEAGDCSRNVIALQPNHDEAHVNLGNVLSYQGNLEEAITHYQKALQINFNNPLAHNNLGNAYNSTDQLDKAVESYKHAIAIKPDYAVAHYNLGSTLKEQSHLDEAMDYFRRAISINPNYAEAYNNLGVALKEQGKLSEAREVVERALKLKPDFAEANYNLGNIFYSQGLTESAIENYRKAVLAKPDYAEAYGELGSTLWEKGYINDAIDCYRRAIAIKPDSPGTYCNLGNLLKITGHLEEAEASYREALRLNPNLAEAHSNLGSILRLYGNRMNDALACYQEALRLKPDLISAHINMGNIYTLLGKLDEALASHQEALRIDPMNALAYSNFLCTIAYHEDYDTPAVFVEHARWGELHGRDNAELIENHKVPDKDKRLRIGYVSGDFRNHSVSFFIEQVLAHHDKTHFEVFCYYNHATNDNMTQRLRRHADHWRDIVSQPDDMVAQKIREDDIDILVDLAGHTAGNRLLTFALKPAPIQATWMGYIATTGLKSMDYIIADRFLIPPQDERYYVEKVVRLPNSYLCFTSPHFPIEVSALPALSRREFTFGCFNNVAKLTPALIATWARLLLALPHSRLFLKSVGFGDEATKKHYQDLFAQHGVGAKKLHFAGQSPRNELLKAYHNIDVCLDPFPYNGGTTTAEALWMGVPVISLRGGRFAGRVGDSFLTSAGLGELVVDTKEEYIAKAIELASDLPRLAELRTELREQLLNSALCDGPGFVHDLEATYRKMWEAWCQSKMASHK